MTTDEKKAYLNSYLVQRMKLKEMQENYIANGITENGSFSIASENRDSLLGRIMDLSDQNDVFFIDARGSRFAYKVSAVYTAKEILDGTGPDQQKPVLNLCCPQGKQWFVAECTAGSESKEGQS